MNTALSVSQTTLTSARLAGEGLVLNMLAYSQELASQLKSLFKMISETVVTKLQLIVRRVISVI